MLTPRDATTSVIGTRQYFSLTKLNRFRRAWSSYAPLVERLGSLTCERGDLPGAMVFRAERSGLEVKVDKRVNVRVLELIHPETGSRIELEGNRVPLTHSKDVIEALAGG